MPNLEKELAGMICPACGDTKRMGDTLCRTDYFKLPRSMQKALYKPIGRGYSSARKNAIHYLKGLGKVALAR